MKYRSDIDGLRAIAVLFVLLFHAGFNYFSSGFIGVDIFFVISGYLITSIINSSVIDGTFSVADFYRRRLWRLQPAFLGVFVFTAIIAVVFYLPNDFVAYMTSSKYAASFMSNIYLARNAVQYAAADTTSLLLLHTWSLSIEWQWYLFLPPGLLLIHRYVPKKFIGFLTLSLTLLALSISLYLGEKYPGRSYYFLSCRIFELMAGSCLVAFDYKKININKRLLSLLGLISLITLFYCATRPTVVYGYPDFHSVIVSLAVVTLIIVGSSGKGITTRILSCPALVFVGTLSYSLYLWHWPIFATAHYFNIKEGALYLAVCFMLTGIAAYLSYIFIEKPFRVKKTGLIKSLLYLVLIPISISMSLNYFVKKEAGFAERFGKHYALVVTTGKEPNAELSGRCYEAPPNADINKCIMGETQSKKRAFLLGDSHAGHFLNFFDVLGKDAHLAITIQSRGACLSLPNFYQWHKADNYGSINMSCHEESTKYYNKIEHDKFDYVIIAQKWDSYETVVATNKAEEIHSIEWSRNQISLALNNAIDIIIKSGATPVIMKQIPTVTEGANNCFSQHIKFRRPYVADSCHMTISQSEKNDWSATLFNQLKNKYPTLIFIDPRDALCTGNRCIEEFDGIPVYRDDNHINNYASLKLGQLYLKLKGNPLKKEAD
ncbi:acyltransferase family protein [Rouxiella sp. T17]|uniref:acyltransferase family protein n=1 Tax=Rouxiella sp. T17 TaxID=3085684 RepID=UPI002FC9652D